ncbi:MAG: cytochrome P450 [Verrucomicrobia bacterium]|nr:cytochrome P450 [Verrucomicrobiota bacterium]
MSAIPSPAGPRGSLLLGNLAEFGKHPLGFLERCAREFGDFVPLRFLHRPVVLLNHPALIEAVLAGPHRQFRKTIGYRTPFMRRLFGQGLLTSDGDFWTRQRRLAQPAFHRERIAGYGGVIAQYTREMLSGWQTGAVRDVHDDVLKLTTRVVVKTLFNAEVPPSIRQLGEASAVVLEQFTRQWSAWRLLWAWFPTAGTRRFEGVMRELDAFIFDLIREGRDTRQDHGDLLSMLLKVRDESGNGMSDRQLRDELVTLMVAGLDTTALAVSWALLLLAQHPESQRRLRVEIHRVVGGRTPGVADLPQLPYTEAVLKESMRLYPPAWLVGREAVEDGEIGGHFIKRGTSLVMSQWLMHRDARYHAEPAAFRPERWLEPACQHLPKFAFFPFGGGPRICIGNSFAMLEATIALVSILQSWQINCEPDYTVEPWPSITLQTRGGIWLKVERDGGVSP